MTEQEAADYLRIKTRQLYNWRMKGLVRYAFPAKRGSIVRGMPTAQAAPPLSAVIAGTEDLPPVWSDPQGSVKGYALEPLYRSAPAAAKRDPKLYELLALVDALRDGRSRERRLAEEELKRRITHADAA